MSKQERDPFEDHIESNNFNVNPLIDAGTNVPHHVLHPRLAAWLDNMPHPSTNEYWDDQLDTMQKRLRNSLATEIVQRGMLGEFAEQLEHIDDETLTIMMHYPITLAMLSQDYFRLNGYPHDWEQPEPDKTSDKVSTDIKQLSVFGLWKYWLMTGVKRLLKWFEKILDAFT